MKHGLCKKYGFDVLDCSLIFLQVRSENVVVTTTGAEPRYSLDAKRKDTWVLYHQNIELCVAKST